MMTFYYYFFFIVTIMSCFHILNLNGYGNMETKKPFNGFLVSIFFLSVVLLIGLLPVPWNSGSDRELYANDIINSKKLIIGCDGLFTIYIKLTSLVLDYKMWFIFTAFIYCFNHYLFAKKNVVKEYIFILMLMFFTSFSFYAYGVNTIRAGFAISFVLLAITHYNKSIYLAVFLLIAIGCHLSTIIPACALLISIYYNNTKLYLYLWLLSIVLSATFGHNFEAFFQFSFFDDRNEYLLVSSETRYNIGFRIDFLTYSCIPVILGCYYVLKKKYNDTLYCILLNTYIIANIFWILVIRANYSDRFAYLSWFLYPVILIYPLLKIKIWENQNRKIALIVFLHGLFSFIMFLVK